MSREDRVIRAIDAAWVVALAAVLAWFGTTCHETTRRYDFEKFRLEQKVEELDALREEMQRREAREVPVQGLPGAEPRGAEPTTEAPVREKR